MGSLCISIADGTHNPPPNTGKGIPLLSAKNVHNGKLHINEATRWISQSAYKQEAKKLNAAIGAVLLTIVGTIGRTAILDALEPFALQRSVCLIRQIKINSQYLASCLESYTEYLNSISSGTAQKGIYLGTVSSLLIPLPPLSEQERIVAKIDELMPLVDEYGKLEEEREQLDEELPNLLRKSALQQAVQGKLVPQDPNDEPASVLLDRIREERHKLIAEGKLKAPKGGESIIYRTSDGEHYEKRIDAKGHEFESVCIEDEIPFEIPDSWEWARLGSICDYGYCNNIEYKDIKNGVWVLELEDIEKNSGSLVEKHYKHGGSGSTKHLFKKGDLLYSKLRPYLNKVVIADEDGAATSEIYPLDFLSLINNQYMQLVLMSPYFLEYANSCSYGVKMPRLGTEDGRKALIPLPPLSEQERIVTKIDELMPLVDEYGKLEEEREQLDKELPDFLRKSVLQQAVQGKLVPQDPNDEPASVLLDRIREERHKLIVEGKLKVPKGGESIIYRTSDGEHYEKRIDAKGNESEPVCIEDEIPFEIPKSWEWTRLESVTTYIQRGKSPKYSSIEKYPVISQKCNQWSGFSLDKTKFIDPNTVQSYVHERILCNYDLLWNSTGLGTLGRIAIYDSSKNPFGWAVVDSHVTVIRTSSDWLNYQFAYAYFSSPSVQLVIEDQASGSTKQKELSQETVKNYLIPLPPLSEQERIVEKVESILQLV